MAKKKFRLPVMTLSSLTGTRIVLDVVTDATLLLELGSKLDENAVAVAFSTPMAVGIRVTKTVANVLGASVPNAAERTPFAAPVKPWLVWAPASLACAGRTTFRPALA